MFTLASRVRDVLLTYDLKPETDFPPSDSGVLNTCYEVDYEMNPERLAQEQAKLARNGFRERNFDIGKKQHAYQLYYYRKIVALAREHGTRVTFIHLPRVAEPHWGDYTKERFEAEVGAPLLRLPESLRRELSAKGYRDHGHMHAPGRAIFLPWLAAELAREAGQ